MPARLLAYGGTSFSERRRIGQWPSIPEATLRDTYGLTANSWCYGVGTLGKQPFLILRQRQNIENRGGYPFSLLLDPGDEVWQRFGWNGGALVASLLQNEPKLLLETPERCSADALERVVSELVAHAILPASGKDLEPLLIASCLQNEPIVVPGERPTPTEMAAMLEPQPVSFRLSAGWLVGGGAAHGRAFAANLVFDDQATVDRAGQRETGKSYSEAWTSVSDPALIENFKTKPIWTWDVELGSFFQALVLLRDLESARDADEALFQRIEEKGQTTEDLDRKINQTATDLLNRGTNPLGPRATSWLLKQTVHEKRKLDSKTASRLDPQATTDELRRLGFPPKAVPRNMQLAREVRVAIWVDYLDRLRAEVPQNLETAIKQLGDMRDDERQQLAQAALAARPASNDKHADWERLRKYPEIWALLEPTIQPLRQPVFVIPERPSRRRERAPDGSSELREALESVLFRSRADSVERDIEKLGATFDGVKSLELDDLIAENCESSGPHFAAAFSGKYSALGDVMAFLSDNSQDRLMSCLAEHEGRKFQSLAARDITHAINNPQSRNAYSRALTRYLVDHPDLGKTVAIRRGEEPKDFDRRLRSMLAKKGRRA